MPFALRPHLAIAVTPIGIAREPVLAIDGAMADPAALVAAARTASDWREQAPGGYPGRRAGLPRSYVRNLIARLDPILRRRLLPDGAVLDRFDCAFSLVTKPARALHPLQRLPHVDIASPLRVALVHFLCGDDFGGTAFYRQQATGLEQVRPEDRDRYLAARRIELAGPGAAGGYPGPQTPGYDRIATFSAAFDRVLAYRSFSLHSGIITDDRALSPDPAEGRLTATFFLDYALPSVTAARIPLAR